MEPGDKIAIRINPGEAELFSDGNSNETFEYTNEAPFIVGGVYEGILDNALVMLPAIAINYAKPFIYQFTDDSFVKSGLANFTVTVESPLLGNPVVLTKSLWIEVSEI